MSGIFYNDLAMTLVQTRRFIQEPIRWGQDIAGFRYTATVLANLNTQTLGPDGGDRIGGVNPNLRGLTLWNSLREQLLAQRRPFRFLVGDVVVADIQTDANTAPDAVDSELGPKPLACNAIQFNGGGSVLVEYTIQWTTLNPCDTREEGEQAILAHAWRSEDDISDTYFLTRTYTGRIHFNPKVIGPANAGQLTADSIKRLFLPPKAQGFHRVSVKAQQAEDEFSYTYTVVDQEPQAFCNSREVVRIEAEHKLATTTPGPREQLGAWSTILGGAAGFAGAANKKVPVSRLANLGRGANLFSGALSTITGFFEGIPLTTNLITVTAFGSPTSRYSELARAARVVALYRLMRGTQTPSFFNGNMSQTDNTDPKSTTVQLEIVYRPRDIAAAGATAQQRWDAGNTTMPTLVGGQLLDRPIQSVAGENIPDSVRQVAYAGTIGTANGWGWTENGYAPDLLSNRDALVRDWVAVARRPDGFDFTPALQAALQAVCSPEPRYSRATMHPVVPSEVIP